MKVDKPPRPTFAEGVILISPVCSPGFKHQGKRVPPMALVNWHAEVRPGESIRIFGQLPARAGETRYFDSTFHVGDYAIFGAYNRRIYKGRITRITAKTVWIARDSVGERPVRFDLWKFCCWNSDLDLTR